MCLLVAAAFIGLRTAHNLQPTPTPVALSGDSVVLVGVPGLYEVEAGDSAVLNFQPHVQAAAVSVRPRYIGDCAAAGWATLGAGRRTSVGGLCMPTVHQQRVSDWPQRVAAAAAAHGDAQLGTLAASVPGCVAAVGPGAALAAARPDSTLARYDTVDQFLAGGLATPCPVTLVDGDRHVDAIVHALAGRPGITLIVTGIGPPPGTKDPRLQLLYTVGASPNGWLTSTSTRRDGIVTLTDLTSTLIDFGRGGATASSVPIDGAPLQVVRGAGSALAVQQHLDAVDALSSAVLRGDLAVGAVGAILGALYLLGILRHRFTVALLVAAWSCILPASMMLTGALPWAETRWPGLLLSLLVADWGIALTVLTLAAARRLKVPVAVVGAAVTVAAFTVDAALGAVMEPGSMLNSRPVNGGRWYGFGNVTFAVYATATLVVLGYIAHRLRTVGRPRAALAAVALLGFGVMVSEGWPSMGADFGGVLVLTPVVLGLLLVWSATGRGAHRDGRRLRIFASGLPITLGRLVVCGSAALLVGGLISWLDWRREPASRSHLGAFVQRILDGDAQDVIARKAVAAAESVVTPAGLGSLVVGAVVWVLIFSRLLPVLVVGYSTIRTTAVAALTTAVLGTLLNDGGITVWYTLTAAFAVSVAALATERAYNLAAAT